MFAKLLFVVFLAGSQARPRSTDGSSQTLPRSSNGPSAHDLCPADQSHFLLPHEYDCTKFYYCEYGLKWETPRDCAPGTEFSFELQVCVHPVMANCTLPGVPQTEAPETEAPETETPVTEAPETEAPETETPETEAPETEAPETEAPETEAPTTSAPASTEASTVSITTDSSTSELTTEQTASPTTTEEPTTPDAPSSTTAAPTTTEEPTTTNAPSSTTAAPTTTEERTTTDAPSSTTAAPTTTEEPTTTNAPSSTTAAPTTTEEVTTTTAAPASTEASVIETTSTAASTDATTEENTEWLENGCPADFDVHWLLPSENDCGKFYQCDFGQKVERKCPASLHFNPTIQVCDWPENAGCIDGESSTTTAPTTTDAPASASTEGSVNEWLENGCPADFDVHWLLPSEKDCGKFYQCVFGQKVERQCPASLHFNPTIQVCDWPENAGCVKGESTTTAAPTTEGPTTTVAPSSTPASNISTTAAPTTTEEPSTTDAPASASTETSVIETTSTAAPTEATTEENTELLENGCPADFDVHWLLPSENDCGKFYQCVFGQKVERKCPASLHFNPTIQVCDWPKNAGCIDGDSSTTAAPTTTDAPASASTEGSVNEWLENGCPADFDVHWLLPSENDCGKFYQCVFGQKIERQCPASLHFNPTIQVCDWPKNAGCTAEEDNGNESSTTAAPTTTEAPVNEWLENGCPSDFDVHWLLPSENDCGKFYQCVFGQKVERQCPASLHFNPTIQVCDWPENAGCVEGESTATAAPSTTEGSTTTVAPSSTPASNISTTAAPTTPEEPTTTVAPSSTPASNISTTAAPTTPEEPTTTVAPSSTPASNISTTAAPTTTEEPTTTEAPISSSTEASVIETTSTAAPTEATTEDNTEWLDNGCPADFDVHWLLPHEKDCELFYYCVSGEKVERECPANLHFNPSLQVCDWPENAGCTAIDGDNDNNSQVDGNNSNENNNTSNGDDNNENVEWLDNGCPADFDVHWLLPHENDCSLFYYCVFGGKVERECPANLHFNPTLQVCDWPENSGCTAIDGDNENNSQVDGNNSNENNNTSNGDDNNENVEWLDNGCPADFDVHWLLPHENDCELFYYCVFGGKVVRECPANLHFNPTLQVCDWPENAGCVNGDSTTTAAPTTTEEPTTTVAPSSTPASNVSTTAAPTTPEESTTTVAPSSTPASNISTTAAPSTPEEPTTTVAPSSTPASNISTTAAPTTPEEPATTVAPSSTPASNISTTAAPTTPEELTTTVAPSSTPASNVSTTAAPTTPEEPSTTDAPASASTEASVIETTSTAAPTEATTLGNSEWLDNGCPADFDVHWLIPSTDDCTKFYQCVFGEKVQRECPANLHFNPTLQVCDWKENAGCVLEDGDNETGSGDGETDGGDNEIEPDHGKCASCNVLPWAHEVACDKYWRCEGETAVLVVCSEGLHFNAQTATCDFICNANCVREVIQTTADERGLRVFLPWEKVDQTIRDTYAV